jgi:tRNA uridine 5-carbamoylmethylation protein Kti12
MKQKILYLITGIPGSGKTTRAKELMREKNIKHHYEADMLMIDRNNDYQFNPRKLKECHGWCQKATERAMKLEEAVIVSNTTTTKWEAKPYIDMAKKNGYNVIIEHLKTEYKNIHNVPQEVLNKMKNRREFFKLEDFE